jgi:hypothetical protein
VGTAVQEKSETPEPKSQDDTNAPKKLFAKSTAPEIPNMFVSSPSEKKDTDNRSEKEKLITGPIV